jgi:hypothetical protein
MFINLTFDQPINTLPAGFVASLNATNPLTSDLLRSRVPPPQSVDMIRLQSCGACEPLIPLIHRFC